MCAQQTLLLRSVRDTPTFVFCFWIAIQKLLLANVQRVQNCAARLICRRKKHDHVTPLLKELHWLPIHVRPTYILLSYWTGTTHVECWGPLLPNYSLWLCHSRRPSGTVIVVSLWQWQLFGISCQTLLGWSRHCHFSERIRRHILLESHFLKYSEVNLKSNLCSARTLAFL